MGKRESLEYQMAKAWLLVVFVVLLSVDALPSDPDLPSNQTVDVGLRRRARNSKLKEHLLRARVRDIGVSLTTTSCTAMMSQDMAQVTTGLTEQVMTKMGETTEGILGMILAPLVMTLMSPATENINEKASPSLGSLLSDLLVLILALPLTLGVVQAFAHVLANILVNILTEGLTFALTDRLQSALENDAGRELGQMMITILSRWMRTELVPAASYTVSAYLVSVIPTALSNTLSSAVINSVSQPITNKLVSPVLAYYYCQYCYTYGSYCQYCHNNKDISSLDRAWWLGGADGLHN
eukprot:c5582_g1_i1.p1 GENE.c5582_g1_i1~~c5582_g1_i1.p1  ORF type:complete len:296 (+),score=49.64 c5582_g1_i1:1-888(+)